MDTGVLFENRSDAGRQLAGEFSAFKDRSDVVVLGLPQGGVPVAFEIATALNAPLDVLIVRKIPVPGHRDLGMGAVASGGAKFINEALVRSLGISEESLAEFIATAFEEVTHLEQAYRGHHPNVELRDKRVILVDDGMGTGATMRAALRAIRQLRPAELVVALPTANPFSIDDVAASGCRVVCLATPEPYLKVGPRYRDFPRISDNDVRRLLERADRNHRKVARDKHAP